MKVLFSCALTLIITATLATAQIMTDDLTGKLEQEYAGSDFPGFCVSVVNSQKTVYQHGFGYADVMRKTPYTVKTYEEI